jgi:hypothetical protein
MPRPTPAKKVSKKPSPASPAKKRKAPAVPKEKPKAKRAAKAPAKDKPVMAAPKMPEESLEEPQAEELPRPRRHITVWQLMAAMVGAACLMAGLIVMVKPDVFRKQSAPAVDRSVVAQLSDRQEFKTWLQGWTSVDEYLKAGEFRLTTSLPITPATVTGADAIGGIRQPRSLRLIVSPDETQAADLFSSFGMADARVLVFRFGGQFEELARLSPPGYYQGGVWLNNDIFVVFGTAAEYRDTGEPLCVAVAGGAHTCVYRLTLDVFDFAAKRHDAYVSEKHGLPSDPFREPLQRRWESSLTPDERLEMGLSDEGAAAETVSGLITTLASNGFVVRTSQEKAADRTIVINARTIVTDEQMNTVGAAFLRPGMTVSTIGHRDSTGRLIATQVAVTKAPSLSIDGVPTDGIFPMEGLALKGEVRHGAKTLVTKLKSRRTGGVLATMEVVFDANDSPWQKFELKVAPETPVQAGEPLTLAVFDPANLKVGETYRLTAAKP